MRYFQDLRFNRMYTCSACATIVRQARFNILASSPRRCGASSTRLKAEDNLHTTPQSDVAEEKLTRNASTKPNPEGLKLQKVEKLGEESWAGVAAVDREKRSASTTRRKSLLLASGDLTALLVFTAIGRVNHGESLDLLSTLKTTAPFLIGWFGAADLQKAFGPEAQGSSVKAAASKALMVWATGIPVGLAVRTAQRGYLPDISFVLVTLVVTFAFLVGWRSGLAALTPDQSTSADSSGRNKRGNPLEFLQLLGSLTKRW